MLSRFFDRDGWRAPSRRWLAGGALGLIVLVALLALFDWTWMRPLVQQFVQQRSGRQVDFERLEVSLDAALQPTFRVHRLRVQNAPWADSRPLVSAAEMGMTLSWRSLFSGPIVVSRLVLIDAELDLERQADGLRNWRLTRPDDRGPGRVRVLSVDAQRTRLRVLHEGAALDMQLEITPLAQPRPPSQSLPGQASLPLTRAVRVKGTRHGVAFEGEAEVSDVVTLFDTGQSFALSGHLQTATSRLQLGGVGCDVLGESTVDLQLHYRAERQDQMARVLGAIARPTPLPAELTARLEKAGGRWTVSALQARLGGSDAAGKLVFEEHGPAVEGARPDGALSRNGLQGALHSNRVDLRELRGVFAGASAQKLPSASPAREAAMPASAPASQAGASPAGRLANIDATLDWTLDQLLALPRFPLSQVKAHLVLRSGKLALAPLSFGVAGGTASGSLTLDNARASREVGTELSLKGLQVAALAPGGKRSGDGAAQLAGTLDARLTLASNGDSLQALAAAARGSLQATLVKASVPAALDAKLGLDGGRWLSAKFKPDERAAITCSALSLTMADGQARVQRLALETAQVALTGSGSVDLPSRSVELTIAPRRKQAALLALDRWLQVRGPLTDAKVTLIPPGERAPGPGCGTAAAP